MSPSRYFSLPTLLLLFLAACATPEPRPATDAVGERATCPTIVPSSCPACPTCPGVEPTAPAERPLQMAEWKDLPGWSEDDPTAVWSGLLANCRRLDQQSAWKSACAAARKQADRSAANLRAWFEEHLRPWAAVQPDGARQGLITGYYEPLLKGSRQESRAFSFPVYGPPDDMIVVDLADVYPELKSMRLRGRLEGRKLLPYYSRAEWAQQESRRGKNVLLWVDDAIDLFFMQVQGSGQVQMSDGQRIRLNYADQNGHPYRSIGRWLIDRGELKADQASMHGIKTWAKAHPQRLNELLNANPSMVFFRELPVEGSGPPGAMGIALTPERSVAVDPRYLPLGAPIWLATTRPNSEQALNRLMLAQDTGGAIRGVVRADFYWGSGAEAGAQAGKMRQQGRMWVLWPKGFAPSVAKE